MIRSVRQVLLSCQGESRDRNTENGKRENGQPENLCTGRTRFGRDEMRPGPFVPQGKPFAAQDKQKAALQRRGRGRSRVWWREDLAGCGGVIFADEDFEAFAGPGEVFAHSSGGVGLDQRGNASGFEFAFCQVGFGARAVGLDED
jgi:hypothetical protein